MGLRLIPPYVNILKLESCDRRFKAVLLKCSLVIATGLRHGGEVAIDSAVGISRVFHGTFYILNIGYSDLTLYIAIDYATNRVVNVRRGEYSRPCIEAKTKATTYYWLYSGNNNIQEKGSGSVLKTDANHDN